MGAFQYLFKAEQGNEQLRSGAPARVLCWLPVGRILFNCAVCVAGYVLKSDSGTCMVAVLLMLLLLLLQEHPQTQGIRRVCWQ
jgi:hypothetical protein